MNRFSDRGPRRNSGRPRYPSNNANLDDYELRKIGSEIEGLIKVLLQQGLLSYNPECRVMNYSMGLPKTKEQL